MSAQSVSPPSGRGDSTMRRIELSDGSGRQVMPLAPHVGRPLLAARREHEHLWLLLTSGGVSGRISEITRKGPTERYVTVTVPAEVVLVAEEDHLPLQAQRL